MRTIVRLRFGSALYGTSTPTSDIDYKSVYIPDARDILLQRVKGSIANKRPKLSGEKNFTGEVDEESYSLQRFLQLAAEGQTVSLDVLFAPEWAMVDEPGWEWREITENRDKLITKKSKAFIGYCYQQSAKYGVKGSRVSAAREALALLESAIAAHGTQAKLAMIERDMAKAVLLNEHMKIQFIANPTGTELPHWEVCGRKMPYTIRLGAAREIAQRLVDEYGQRALQAERNEGIDWKALSHAVRVGRQAIELLNTGYVTFPLPDAAHILDIKLGRITYQEVAGEIEGLLELVESAAAASKLPDKPDLQWIDDFVARIYGYEVRA